MLLRLLLAGALACALPASAEPRTAGIKDPDTRAWWRIAEHLSSDAMEGRDIGSPGHDRAGRWVADQFKAAGLTPAGDNGTWFQSFPVHESRVEAAQLHVEDGNGQVLRPQFLADFSVTAADDLPPNLDAPMVFAGYCRPEDLTAAKGKVVFCINSRRKGLTSAADRARNARAAGAAALAQVDDPGFTIEPFRWPAAYARTITLADAPPRPSGGFVSMTMSAASRCRPSPLRW